MKHIGFAIALVAIAAAAPASASVVLDGNYIKVGISDRGTLGSNGSISPGLIHDPSGTATFDPATDYITPGTPHEGFSVNSTQTGFIGNDNTGTSSFATISGPTILTGAAALGFNNAATWTGANAFLNIVNSYFFNDGDEIINVTTTITALQNITNLAFARSVDPNSGGFDSLNQRGNSLYGTSDFIGSASAANGRTLALVNLNGEIFEHNTRIDSSCCSNINPYTVLAGSANNTSGDNGLNLAYRIGDLAAGSSATIKYAYAVGTKIETVGSVGAVPEPATWMMMMLGMGGIGFSLRRKKQTGLRVRFA